MGWFKDSNNPDGLKLQLIAACNSSDAATAKKLLDSGVPADFKMPEYNRPIMYAMSRFDFEIVKLLLERGADVNTNDGFGSSSLLIIASEHGRENFVSLLLSHKPNLTYQSEYTGTALHTAAYRGHFPVVLRLLEHGADINARLNDGSTALHKAASQGHLATVKALIERGADPTILGNGGTSPYEIALMNKRQVVADYIKEILPRPPAEGNWTLKGDDTITHVEDINEIGYRLTSIFNFRTKKYVHITHNLETKGESHAVKFFSEIPDTQVIVEAYDTLVRLGGKAEAPFNIPRKPAVKQEPST